jgi:osmotically-inducible protein OsmY
MAPPEDCPPGAGIEGTARGDGETVAEWLDDARLAAEIRSALLVLLPMAGLRVRVWANRGVVYLRGPVLTDDDKQAVEKVVEAVRPPGVTRIVNELTVDPNLPPVLMP